MTKSSFPLCTVDGAVVRREGLILTWGDLAGRRQRETGAARTRETASVEPGEKSAEVIVVEENEPESVKLSKDAGWSHFDEGSNVDREGSYSDSGTPELRRYKSDQTEPRCGTRRVQSLMAASEMALSLISRGARSSRLMTFTNRRMRTRTSGGVGAAG